MEEEGRKREVGRDRWDESGKQWKVIREIGREARQREMVGRKC